MIVTLHDDSGALDLTFFNQPWLAEKLTPGTGVRLRGKLGRYGFDVKSYDIGEARRTAASTSSFGWRARRSANAIFS